MLLSAIGDSIVKGFGVGEENSFVYFKKNNLKTLNLGENGATSQECLRQLAYIDGDLVLIYVGINDFLLNYSLNKTIENIVKITDCVKKKGKKIILCSPHRISGDATEGWCNSSTFISANHKLKNFNLILKGIAFKDNYYFIDYYNLLNKVENYDNLFFDGIHPTKETHNLMRKELMRVIGDFCV
ncbi:SGNH/GDSL hydrolase family protein [Anaerosphaera multitolerans]|uniref:SGNH hydrolase-type esterase domain-containing protein n=1 Tax=Anaerosphaera multitolerans TaxID=2487351 RepID=A0A437S7E2_9FIRM|nr:GDSL-type esterase/lipase family protein [Anaerosphaera multitolerans]RVU54966.1 hypothetical protein EF514_05110 [Anaerosphaera multitolerans]